MPRTITPEGRERMREAGRRGGQMRAKAFTTEYQRAVASLKSSEDLARAGRAGWKANVAKYGVEHAARQVAKHRLKNPSRLERAVAEFLDASGVGFEREAEVQLAAGIFFVDFRLADGRLIEVDGAPWHASDSFHGEDRARRDRMRAAALVEAGFVVLRISEAEVNSGAAWLKIEKFIEDKP